MKHVVVGTAGHVDHGKTSLVAALTGVDCDRLPEEKRRGITIELGFAPWQISKDVAASVVDVPGHERFVRTMAAGATGVDLVILCVAADDGVMPQTREHLAISTLLGVASGVVAITKCDLADAETLALVDEDVAAAVRGTFLEGAPVVRCSARAGVGLDALTRAVAKIAAAVPSQAARARGPAYLAIDRVFTKAGAGAIVTGTLARGALAVGEDVDLLPLARGESARAKIRGLQVHGQAVARAEAPVRLAVNLRGVEEAALVRGAALTTAGWQTPTRVVVAELELAPTAKALGRRSSLTLHLGTAQRAARVSLQGGERLEPGSKGLARIALGAPVAAYAGQRFVLRRPELARDRTVGGGRVLDPHPRARRGRPIAGEDVSRRVSDMVEEARYAGIDLEQIARRLPPGQDARSAVAALERARALVEEGGRYYAAALVAEAERAALACIETLHAERPLVAGVARAEVETRIPARLRGVAPAAIAALLASKKVVEERGLLRLASRGAAGGEVFEKLAAMYAHAGLTPPLDEEARAALGIEPRPFKDALAELKRRGSLRLLGGGLHFDAASVDALKGRVAQYFGRTATMTPVDFKALCGGLSRKYAIPLLEWLDAQGVTRRQGEARVRGPAAPRA